MHGKLGFSMILLGFDVLVCTFGNALGGGFGRVAVQ